MTTPTCDTMLDAMLEADVEELEGRGSSVLARHVRECAKCRAVAERLAADSHMLGVAVRRASPVDLATFAARTRFSRRTLVGSAVAAIAASVLFVMLVQHGMRDYANADQSFAVVKNAPALPPGVGAERDGVHARPADAVATATASVAKPVEPQRFADAAPVAPVEFAVPFDADAASDAAPAVTVSPPPGRHAVVMRGRNPKITVVWLY